MTNYLRLWSRGRWTLEKVAPPWDPESRPVLVPQEDPSDPDAVVAWARGAQRGEFSRFSFGMVEDGASWDATRALTSVFQVPNDKNLARLYRVTLEHQTLHYVDDVVAVILGDPVPAERLYELGRWFACRAPHLETVKLGIALLSIVGTPDDRALLLRLAVIEELTQFALVALTNRFSDWESDVFELARNLTGWGRIEAIHFLASTTDSKVRNWMLREGYRNSVHPLHSALICAVSGNLIEELKNDPVEPEVLDAAADIMPCLLRGGPSPDDIYNYQDGIIALALYVSAVERALPALPGPRGHRRAVGDLVSFLEDDEQSWPILESIGWVPEVRNELLASAQAVLDSSKWDAAPGN